MSSPYVSAGPGAAPSTSQTPISRAGSGSTEIPPAPTVSIVVFLLLFMLAALGAAVRWVRRRWTISKVSEERPSEKAPDHDVEALAATRPVVPVTPLPEVRWTPQIRSISGPTLNEGKDRKPATPHPRRARSPPPPKLLDPRNVFPDPYPKFAPPAHTPSFSQSENPHLKKSWREELGHPVTPQALAVSGMQTRSLGRPWLGSKN